MAVSPPVRGAAPLKLNIADQHSEGKVGFTALSRCGSIEAFYSGFFDLPKSFTALSRCGSIEAELGIAPIKELVEFHRPFEVRLH